MLELVRYQKKAVPEEETIKECVLSSAQVLSSEKNRHEALGKYVESITYSISPQVEKKLRINRLIWESVRDKMGYSNSGTRCSISIEQYAFFSPTRSLHCLQNGYR